MQVGIDSFAAWDNTSLSLNPSERLRKLVEQIEFADKVGLDLFGIGEHHRKEFLDSTPTVILGAAAARRKTHTSDECCNSIKCYRSRPTLSRIRNPGSFVTRSSRDGCWPRFIC